MTLPPLPSLPSSPQERLRWIAWGEEIARMRVLGTDVHTIEVPAGFTIDGEALARGVLRFAAAIRKELE